MEPFFPANLEKKECSPGYVELKTEIAALRSKVKSWMEGADKRISALEKTKGGKDAKGREAPKKVVPKFSK